ncbi:hypothetical protein BDY19DRAFT_985786 [Irpex rosettiformis]|uniref:Uncharacterized protein n=1 Tax=Irpex rosettiformis TaxID=378272 RepID=A0ACB8U1J1_9APHY|nr:hypothetical protein BDY19DRAFT_985786 [Irpex rosettiformis]
MFPVPTSSGVRTASLPTRTVSLASTQAATFTAIEEELRDVRRVHSQGQEEDLRMALSRTIGRVEELSSMLKEAYRVQADLQTELTLAKSNLQLALANNEMLEDALKRDGGNSKDVGWRRMSTKEQRERELAADSRRQSTDSLGSTDIAPSPVLNSPHPATAEPRFFKFRFGSSTPGTQSPRVSGSMSPIPNGSTHASHLTSASLPSLVPVKDRDKEVEDLTTQLEQEKEKHKSVQAAKEALEAELESLSQALFEEANKMVAVERMRLAETTEELKEAQAEKEALRSALRLVEHQRELSSSRESSIEPPEHRSRPISYVHSHKRSSSSAIAIKSTPSSPQSVIHVLDESPVIRAAVPPPLDLPEVGLANLDVKLSSSEQSSVPTISEPSSETSSLAPPSSDDLSTGKSSSSPTPSPGQFGFKTSNPISYFDGEESPWADARSATPISAAF